MMMARPKGKPRAAEDIRKAVEMYIAGDKMNDIAAPFGVTQPTVSYWMKRHGKRIGKKRFIDAQRKQGRRQDEEPNDRDKEIVYLASLGVPASHLALQNGVSRARASYIIKTWLGRGYVPPPIPFKVGQTIKDGPKSPSRFIITEVNGTIGTVLQTHGLLPNDTFGKFAEPRQIKDFHWYVGGELCEVVNDAPAS